MPETTSRRKRKRSDRELEPVNIRKLRASVGEVVNAAHYGNKRVPVLKRGKEVGAVIGAEDLKILRQLDDAPKKAARSD